MIQISHQLDYRADIDGLRAVAVLPVVFHHARFPGFDGGFVGVDVFFVISGYLISSIIIEKLDRGTFSFAEFYQRRMRRILPAFVAVVLACSLAALVLLPPGQLIEFGRSAISASLFFSNFLFSTLTGYFDGPALLRPLLHTWSLSVEEQFYILWPAAMYAAYRLRLDKPRLAFWIAIVALASLILAQWMSGTPHAARYFFLPQVRIWELMIGALLALHLLPRLQIRWQREVLGLAGLAMIAWSVVFFSATTPFPSLWTLLPCLGAAFLIHGGASGSHVTARFLSLPPMVFIGLISYSFYLWHWPILSFAAAYLYRPVSLAEASVLIALAFVLSILSWRYVELPFRRRTATPFVAQRVFASAAAASLLTIGIGAAFVLTNGLAGRLDQEAMRFAEASNEKNPLRKLCHTDRNVPRPAAQCIVPPATDSPSYDVLIWGDSHADALFPASVGIADRLGLRSRQASRTGCPPLIGVDRINIGEENKLGINNCSAFNDAMLQILREERPKLVILVARWSLFTHGRGRQQSYLVSRNEMRGNLESSREILQKSLKETVRTLNELGIRVLLIAQAPEFGSDPNFCFVRQRMRRADTTECLRRPRESVDAELALSTQYLAEAAQLAPMAALLKSTELFCDKDYCWAAKDGVPLYFDSHHMSPKAAQLLAAHIVSILE